ncbi:hypothetical protein MKW94_014215 [Papaver nudicaule]|uniref:Uncharacterized protein n=1 Tax=Papaver nudicaule TaxID=74823 RepID=A0AA41VKX5_PAPNU|nr:hypothetical protein [Papaver nudicaule]
MDSPLCISIWQQDKHIDWMRIGAFFFDSSFGLLTEKLPLLPRLPIGDSVEKMLQTTDLQLVRCPVCNQDTCEGTLDARHIELFLTEGYKSGSWDYKEIGSHEIMIPSAAATGAILDIKHLKDRATKGNLRTWKLNHILDFFNHACKLNQKLCHHSQI